MDRLSALKNAYRALVRSRSPVVFGDLSSTAPVSRAFGLDRGTPVDRYYIGKFVAANATRIAGRALEVAELKYLNLHGEPRERCVLAPRADIVKADGAIDQIVVGDLTRPESLGAKKFDCFVCTQTLHVIYDVHAAIRGAHHLLAPGGHFIGTAPGISQISRYDMDRWGDYWRFTTRSMQQCLEAVFGPDVAVETFGNVVAAQAVLLGLAVEDVPDRAILDARDEDYQVIIGFRATKAS